MLNVILLLAPGCSAASVTLAQEVLHAANLFNPAGQVFEICLVSADGQPVESSAGGTLAVNAGLAESPPADLVLIPGFLFSLQAALPLLADYGPWLRRQHERGAVLASMCNAAFMLADSGLLAGRQVTTHWAFADLFRRRYPGLTLDEQRILCDTGDVITSGGATAVIDLMLHIVRRFASRELAQTCSRYLLIDNGRPQQSAYVMWTAVKKHGDESILQVQDWLEEHFCTPLRIDEIAARFGFGVRNFKRRFKDATGQTPLNYLQDMRLERAKYLLETTKRTLDSITYDVGYEDSNSFRRLFQGRVGMSPAEYRRQFRQP